MSFLTFEFKRPPRFVDGFLQCGRVGEATPSDRVSTMNPHLMTIAIGPELDATFERLSEMFGKPREELAALLLEEAAYAIEDTYEKSGQIWDSIRFDYVHGGRRSIKRVASELAIDAVLQRAQEMGNDTACQ